MKLSKHRSYRWIDDMKYLLDTARLTTDSGRGFKAAINVLVINCICRNRRRIWIDYRINFIRWRKTAETYLVCRILQKKSNQICVSLTLFLIVSLSELSVLFVVEKSVVKSLFNVKVKCVTFSSIRKWYSIPLRFKWYIYIDVWNIYILLTLCCLTSCCKNGCLNERLQLPFDGAKCFLFVHKRFSLW